MTRVPPRCFSLSVKRHSLWDMNKDVLSAVGGPDEAVTLWSGEVLTHALEHWTWVSAHRSANKDRKVWTFSGNGGDLPQEKRTWGQHLSSKDGRSAVVSRTNPPTRLTPSRCACVWSVMGLADLWAAAALFHLPILGFSPSGRGRRGRGMCWESAAAYPRATWGQGPPWQGWRQRQIAPLLPGADCARASAGWGVERRLSRCVEVSWVASSLSEGTCC